MAEFDSPFLRGMIKDEKEDKMLREIVGDDVNDRKRRTKLTENSDLNVDIK